MVILMVIPDLQWHMASSYGAYSSTKWGAQRTVEFLVFPLKLFTLGKTDIYIYIDVENPNGFPNMICKWRVFHIELLVYGRVTSHF